MCLDKCIASHRVLIIAVPPYVLLSAQVHVVHNEADYHYLLGLSELDRENVLADRCRLHANARSGAWAVHAAAGARFQAHPRSVNGGNGAGPSRPPSPSLMDTSRTVTVPHMRPGDNSAEVEQSAPMTRARTGAVLKVRIE